ncbi:MAG: AsnC family transcriptional regulator [Candidatus Wolframiiraptor sp.]|nr:MAG: AsnC family transcriptional regulator [Candidatus Wolframiiraptor sp.]
MRRKINIDNKDLKILSILQEDGRAPYSEIARKMGMSEAAVYSRIQKLIKNHVIKKIQAILDPEKLGYKVTAFISVTAQPAKYNKVLEALSKLSEILEIHDVTGQHYCLVKVRTRDKEDLAKILDRIGTLDGVTSTETKIVLRTIKENYDLPI